MAVSFAAHTVLDTRVNMNSSTGPEPPLRSQKSAEPERLDPTKMLNQPALRTSSGRIWLVMGGLFAAITGTLFVLLAMRTEGSTQLVAVVAGSAVAVCLVVLIVVRLTVKPGAVRLRAMAASMLTMAAIALIGMWLAGVTASNAAA
jgi:hypothetical protein